MNINSKYAEWQQAISGYTPEKLEDTYHQYRTIFSDFPLPIAWLPDETAKKKSNLARVLTDLNLNSYADLFNRANRERQEFWEYTIRKLGIVFHNQPDSVLTLPEGVENPVWLANARLNIVDSCLKAPAEKIAIIEGNETNTERSITYGELKDQVERFSNGLVQAGFKKRDRIAFYLPFCIEAVVAYLGVIHAGLVVVSVADSFSPEELKKRIRISEANAVITVEGYQYSGKYMDILSKVKQAGPVKTILISGNRKPLSGDDMLFDELISSKTKKKAESCEPQSITNILFSSGTTKEPKAIPWTHLTPIKCASDGFYHQDIQPQDVVCWTTGMGWMMAPWLIYATLINDATMALFNGAATTESFGRFAEKSAITILGTIPSVVKSWKKQDFHEKFRWKARLFSSTGEPSNAEDYFYLMALGHFRAPVIEYCGGTEIGGGYITGSLLQAASPATFTTPALGLDFYLLGDSGTPVDEHEPGEVFLVPPSIGLTQTLLNKNHHEEYYQDTPKGPNGEVLRRHGDAFEKWVINGHVFYKSIGRTDDAMNLGGIKVSAVEIEEIVNLHQGVLESAAVSIPSAGGGPEKLILFITTPNTTLVISELKTELQKLVTERLNPLFRISEIIIVDALPRTASNKIMRRELRKRALDR